MRNVGLDLGARKISFCEVREGKVIDRRTVGCLAELKDVLGPKSAKARVAVEACCEAWHVNDELAKLGHEVVLVDTTRVKRIGIGQHGRKTDRIDAEVLAIALESGHIPVAHTLSPHRRELRSHLMVRRGLIEMRSQFVTTLKHILRTHGLRLAKHSAETFAARYAESEVPKHVRAVCDPLVAMLEAVAPQIADVDEKIIALSKKEPIIPFLMSVPGVGLMVAAMFVSVIDDAQRFASAHQVQSYLGLVPSEDSSGQRRRIGAISKHGNSYARALLVQAASVIMRVKQTKDTRATPLIDPLREWVNAIAARRGKKIASVALARRLVGVLWAMWRDGTVYDPTVVGRASASGKIREAQSTQLQAVAIARATEKTKKYLRPASTQPGGSLKAVAS